MRYPIVRYHRDADDRRLVLHLMDGTARAVVFGSASGASAALLPGRADIDAAAILMNRMPRDAVRVEAAVARPAAELMRETFDVSEPACYDSDEERHITKSVAAAAARGRALSSKG